MATRTRDQYQALCIPDPRAVLVAGAVGDTAGLHVGQPEPVTSSRMALVADYRERTSTDSVIEVRTVVGGMPANSASGRPAAFLWRRDGETDDKWRGWNGWTVLQRVDKVHQESGTASFNRPCVVTTPGGIVCAVESTVAGVDGYTISRAPLDGGDLDGVAFVTGLPRRSGYRGCCALVYTSDGRLMMYAAQTRTTGATANTIIRAWSSTNYGTTWARVADNVLPSELADDLEVRRIRVAERGGQSLMVVQFRDTTRTHSADYLAQYASNDGGFSFAPVGEQADTNASCGGFPDVQAAADGFYVAWVDIFDRTPRFVRLATAYHDLTTVAAVEMTATTIATNTGSPKQFSLGGFAFTEADDGSFVAYACNYGTGGMDTLVLVSEDRGLTWTERGAWLGSSLSVGNGNPGNPAVACQSGHMLLVAGDIPATSTLDESVTAYTLGGYSNLTATPGRTTTGAAAWQPTPWVAQWIPVDLPENYGWTTTDDASIAVSYASGRFRVSSSAATQDYRRTIDTSPIRPTASIQARTGEAPISRGGSSTYAGPAYIEAMVGATGTQYWRVRASVDSDGVHYARWNGSAWTDTASTLVTLTGSVDIRLDMAEDVAKVWYRDASAGIDEPWTLAHSKTPASVSALVTNLAAAFGGQLDNGEAVSWVAAVVGYDALTDFDVETDGFARPFSPLPLDVSENVVLQARGGPTVPGDEWTVGFDYQYPRDNLGTASPRQEWRSCATDDQPDPLVIEWTLSSGADSAVFPGTGIAIPIIGHNVPTVSLGTKTGGAWTNVTIDLGITGVGFERMGSVVTAPLSSGHDGTFAGRVRENEFAGGTWYSAVGEVGRRIIGNTAGTWSRTTTDQLPRLILDGVDDVADLDVGAAGIIVPPQAVIIGPVSQSYTIDAIRIRIDRPDASMCEPPDGYWRIGYAWPCRVLAHPDEQDWGRTIETVSPTETTDLPGHVRRTRVTGPPRRRVSFAWADGGVDTSLSDVMTFSTSGWSPSYTAGPLARAGDTPWQIESLVDVLNGSDAPVLYVPQLDYGATIQVLNRRHDLVHMRLTSPVRLETVQGSEGVDEVIRVAVVTGEEEV